MGGDDRFSLQHLAASSRRAPRWPAPTPWPRGDRACRSAPDADPDSHGRLELTKFHTPPATTAEPNAPANTLGLRSFMFAVDGVDDAVARLRAHGGELVGGVAQYDDSYRLCYVRGPQGILVALAEQLS